MTWKSYHHRGEILRTVIATADERLDGKLPTDVAGVREQFSNELDLIAALMLKWHARLSGNVERELMKQPLDLEAAVAEGATWVRVGTAIFGSRAPKAQAA